MQVFKFGGASIQNAEAVKKTIQIIQAYQSTPLIVVVSAIGKTTHALEAILKKKQNNQPYAQEIRQLFLLHQPIASQVGAKFQKIACQAIAEWKKQLVGMLSSPSTANSFDRLYSPFLAHGELIASRLIYYGLQAQGIACQWVDARAYVKTKHKLRQATIDWEKTEYLVKKDFTTWLAQKKIILTQGFIGCNKHNETTTLGKGGSDFTGAVLAATLKATSLTIWKDVPGIMNADPKTFKNTVKIHEISYQEMFEMAFYGAKVVHPKTIQPLAANNIPLYVKPFEHPDEKGTKVMAQAPKITHIVYVLRQQECLLTFYHKDFTFFNEKNLNAIFHWLDQLNMATHMMEQGPSTFSICVHDAPYKINKLRPMLSGTLGIDYHQNLSLLTIKNYNEGLLKKLLKNNTVLLEKKIQNTCQIVFKNKISLPITCL